MTKEPAVKKTKKAAQKNPEQNVEEIKAEAVVEKSPSSIITVVKKGIDFDSVRNNFSFKNNEIYLNNASLDPIPMPVKKALDEFQQGPDIREYVQ